MGYGFALLCAAATFGVQWLLRPWLPPMPFLLLLAGVMLAALVGGRGPGWFATVVSALLAQVFLTDASGTPHPGAPVGTALFIAVGGFAATLGGRRPWLASPREAGTAWAGARSPLTSALLRCTGDAMLVTDARGGVRYLNPAAARLLGLEEVAVVGKPVAQVLHLLRADRRERVPPAVSQVLGASPASPASPRAEQPRLLLRPDGGEQLVQESAVPLLGHRDELLGAVLVLRDASERHRLARQHADLLAREHAALREAQTQRERMESLFQQAPVTIAVFRGPDHLCELLNPPALELIEVQGPYLGRPLREVLPAINAGLLRLVDEVFQTGVPFSGHEVPLLLKPRREDATAGLGRYFDLTWQPWHGADGAIQGVMAVAVEVTGLVNARRAAEVLAEEAQEALRTRDEFLSIASHELKTPITSLQLQLEMLWREVKVPRGGPREDGGGMDSAVRKRVEAMLRPVARLHQLVATLLDVSRIRAGRLHLQQEPVDLSALVQDLVTRAQEDAASARCPVHVRVEGPLVGHWDRMRLEQVIINLLSNAFKYGAQRPVEVRVTREKEFARLIVRDHGIGIAPEDHQRIFQRFERAVSERHYGGLGLGLWIVRQILESLNGAIEVRSQPGQGATFIVSLPLDPAASAVA
jgi:PAS domain S-box-containing protein